MADIHYWKNVGPDQTLTFREADGELSIIQPGSRGRAVQPPNMPVAPETTGDVEEWKLYAEAVRDAWERWQPTDPFESAVRKRVLGVAA